jgi:hypothetical protein
MALRLLSTSWRPTPWSESDCIETESLQLPVINDDLDGCGNDYAKCFRFLTKQELGCQAVEPDSGIVMPFDSLIREDYGMDLCPGEIAERVIYPTGSTVRDVGTAIMQYMARPIDRSEIKHLPALTHEMYEAALIDNMATHGRNPAIWQLATHSFYIDNICLAPVGSWGRVRGARYQYPEPVVNTELPKLAYRTCFAGRAHGALDERMYIVEWGT